MSLSSKLSKLRNIKLDLGDDGGSISTINSDIQSVSEDFSALIKISTGSSVCNKIESLKELYQNNDANIITAKSYCEHEIAKVCREIAAAAAANNNK